MEIGEPLMMVISILYISVFVVFANRFNKNTDTKNYVNCASDWMK